MNKYFVMLALIFLLQSFVFSEEVNMDELDKQLFPFKVIDFNASSEVTALVEKTIEKEFSPDFKIVKIDSFKLKKNFDPNPEIYLPEIYDMDFSFDDKNISNQVLVKVWLESTNLSKFGLTYSGYVSYKIDKEKIIAFNDVVTTDQSIGSDLTLDSAKKLIEKFENNSQVKEFLSQFPDAKQKYALVGYYNFSMTSNDGYYSIRFSPFADKVESFSLPSRFEASFPLIKEFKEEVKKRGCTLDESTAITVYSPEDWLEGPSDDITISGEVQGNCVKDFNDRIVIKKHGLSRIIIIIAAIIIETFTLFATSIRFILNLLATIIKISP